MQHHIVVVGFPHGEHTGQVPQHALTDDTALPRKFLRARRLPHLCILDMPLMYRKKRFIVL